MRIKSPALETPLKGNDRPDSAARLILKKNNRLDGGVPARFSTGIKGLTNRNHPIRAGLESKMLNQFSKGLFAHAVHRREVGRATTD